MDAVAIYMLNRKIEMSIKEIFPIRERASNAAMLNTRVVCQETGETESASFPIFDRGELEQPHVRIMKFPRNM